VAGSNEADEHFGFAVSSGDFNGDGFYGLALGAPKEYLGVGGNNNDGVVHILRGGTDCSDRLAAPGNHWYQ